MDRINFLESKLIMNLLCYKINLDNIIIPLVIIHVIFFKYSHELINNFKKIYSKRIWRPNNQHALIFVLNELIYSQLNTKIVIFRMGGGGGKLTWLEKVIFNILTIF